MKNRKILKSLTWLLVLFLAVILPDFASADSVITVVSPNKGEIWVGSFEITDTISGFESYRKDIEWIGAPDDFESIHNGIVKAYLEKYENGSFITIGRIPPFSYGSLAWVVGVVSKFYCDPLYGMGPNSCFNRKNMFVVPVGYYYVRVVNTQTGDWDRSDMPFLITAEGSNQPPVISGISGPTVLKINETGTWTIKASDPENGTIDYYAVWGDEPNRVSFGSDSVYTSAFQGDVYEQTVTFTHSYARPCNTITTTGSCTPLFTVTDNRGLSAEAGISVRITDIGDASVITENNIFQKFLLFWNGLLSRLGIK